MKVRGPKGTSATVVVLAVVAGLLAFVLSSVVTSRVDAAFALTSGKGFKVTGTVEKTYSSGTCTGGVASLFPGTPSCLLYTLTDPLDVPITVTSVTAAVTGFTPAQTTPELPACALSWVTITPFSGSVGVPAGSTRKVGVPIELTTTGTTQSNCEGGVFHFTFHASATFTDASKTLLTGSPNPATPGATVRFTAKVTGTNPTYDTTTPTGDVTFVTCTTAGTCAHPKTLGTATLAKTGTSGRATFTTSSLPNGKTYVQARFTTSNNLHDFAPSGSNIVTEVVGSVCPESARLCLEFLTEPARTQTDHTIDSGILSTGTPVIVEVVKGTGGVTTSFSGSVTIGKIGNPAGSTLSGTLTVTVVTGKATFTSLSITHAGSYKLVASATRSPPISATSTRFNVDTELVHCTSHPCSAQGTATHGSVTVTESTSSPDAGYVALGFGGAPTFTCGGTRLLGGRYVATVDVLTSKGASTPQNGTTWTVTYTISKTVVKTTGPEGASKWQVCFADTTPFTALTGPAKKVSLTTGGGPVTYYVGLLRDCSKSVTAPCVASRHKTNAGQEVITIEAAGDSYVRP